MADILSQAEIDALIHAMSDGGGLAQADADAEAGSAGNEAATASAPRGHAERQNPARDRRLRVYDFRRPDKFSKDQLRTISMIHDNFTRLLTTYFSATFRTMLQVSLLSVDQVTYGEFTRGISEPAIMGVFSLPPLKGTAVLDLQPSVAFPMLDRLFGGPGQSLDKIRALTDIETSVMERLIRGFLSSLREAWQNVVAFEPKLEAIETNPLFAQVVAPNEICVAVTVEIRVGEHRGNLQLCLPYLVLEPVVPKLSAHNWFASAQRETSPEMLAALNRRLEEARVPVVAVLGEATVTFGELLNLEPGDVVLLNRRARDEITVLINTRPKFAALPGTLGGRLALRLTRVIEQEEEERDE